MSFLEKHGLPKWGLRTLRILKRTARAFVEDHVNRLGAALAFYTTIAVAPMMVLAISVAGLFFEDAVARERVVHEIQDVVGQPAAEVVASIENPIKERQGLTATLAGGVTLIVGALGVFRHMQDALNSIWRVEAPDLGFWKTVRRRLFSFAVVSATGFLLLVSLILSAGLSWLATRALHRLGVPVGYFEAANLVISFIAITVLFALIFQLLPDRRIPWRHVWLGALVTALLFTLGKYVLGLYLAHARIASAYGAASSIVALLVWCYYAAQIVFLGAEFTRVTTLSDGGRDFSRLDRREERVRVADQRSAKSLERKG